MYKIIWIINIIHICFSVESEAEADLRECYALLAGTDKDCSSMCGVLLHVEAEISWKQAP